MDADATQNLHPTTGLLDVANGVQLGSYSGSRELRDMIIQEFRATDDVAERAALLEIHDMLMDNLKRSAAPGTRMRLQIAHLLDRRRMDRGSALLSGQLTSWLVTMTRPLTKN